MRWFRMYADAVDSEKLRLLAFEDRWHFVALLCCKSQGILDSSESLVRRKIAVKLGLGLRELDEVGRRLSEVGLVDEDTLQPIGWDEKQYVSDNVTQRVKRYRERMKQGETLQQRYGNVSETPPDTDTDTETDKEKPKARANALPDWLDKEAWADWKQYRGKTLRGRAIPLCIAKLKELAVNGVTQRQIIDQSIERGWTGLFQLSKPRESESKQADMARFAAVLTGKAKGGIPDFIDMGEAQRVERIER